MVLRCHLTGVIMNPNCVSPKPTQWILSTLGERQWRKGHKGFPQILVSRAMLDQVQGSILEHLHELWRQSLSVSRGAEEVLGGRGEESDATNILGENMFSSLET